MGIFAPRFFFFMFRGTIKKRRNELNSEQHRKTHDRVYFFCNAIKPPFFLPLRDFGIKLLFAFFLFK